VYVSDLELGVIWKFDRAGHGGVWSDDPLLGWTEQTGTWNANNGTVLGYIGINTVALSPDGRYLFAGTDGGPGGELHQEAGSSWGHALRRSELTKAYAARQCRLWVKDAGFKV